MKSMWQSKVFWVNVLSAVLAVLALPEVGALAPTALPYIGGVTAIVNVILRTLTTEPATFRGAGFRQGPPTLPVVLLAVALSSAACAGLQSAQPMTLSPEAQVAWRNLEVVRVLDLVRDIAIDAEAKSLLSTSTTRRVVSFHVSALTALKASESGWPALVLQALDDLSNDIPGKDQPLLGPYVELIRKALKR